MTCLLPLLVVLLATMSGALSITFFPVSNQTQQNFYPKTLTTKEYNQFMIDYIVDYYNKEREAKGWKPVLFNPALMDISKAEAARLASAAQLKLPEFKLVESYQGFSYRYYRKKKSEGGYEIVSDRICYDNILATSVNSTELKEDCDVARIKSELLYEIGFGSHLSKSGELFACVVYLSSQEKNYVPKISDKTSVQMLNTIKTGSLAPKGNDSSMFINDINKVLGLIPNLQQNIKVLSNMLRQILSLIKEN